MQGPGFGPGFVIATVSAQDPWSPIHHCSHFILFLSDLRQDITLKDSQSIDGYDYWRRVPVAGLKATLSYPILSLLELFCHVGRRDL